MPDKRLSVRVASASRSEKPGTPATACNSRRRRIYKADLPHPVQFQGCGADHKDRPLRGTQFHGHDSLTGFTHLTGARVAEI